MLNTDQLTDTREKLGEWYKNLFDECAGYFDEEWFTKSIEDIPEELRKAIKTMVDPKGMSEKVVSLGVKLSFAYYIVLHAGGVPEELAKKAAQNQSKTISLMLLLKEMNIDHVEDDDKDK